jgi:uncharacterized membrane protein
MAPRSTQIKMHDVAQLVVGALVLGFPVAVTEEVWDLSESLPWTSIIPVIAWSIFVLGGFIYYLHHQGGRIGTKTEFASRLLLSYGLTLVCCAIALALVDKFPIFGEPETAIKRVILVAFPASFAATVVDSMS